MEEEINIEKVVPGVETNYVYVKTTGEGKYPNGGHFSNKVHQKRLQEISERPKENKVHSREKKI